MEMQPPPAVKSVQSCDASRSCSPPPMKISRNNSVAPPNSVAASQSARKEEVNKERQRDAVRQAIFEKFSNEALEIPNGYLKVAVKIIRWDESIDDFPGHTSEIERLRDIFANMFGYECSVHSICDKKKPQIDLNKAILDHVHEHDDPHSLLIICYMGHGSKVNGTGVLELSATDDFSRVRGRHMATALWHKAEEPVLNDMDGDALVILDCCMASAAVYKDRSQGSRIYQLLAASAEDMRTYGPGPKSFTTALCDSLEELVTERRGGPFLLTQLSEKINEKRKSQPCLMWDRLRSYKRTVQLGPLHQTQEDKQKLKAAFQKNEPERASITLRISLKVNDLENDQIEKLAEQLPRLCHETKIPLRRIYWEGMTVKKRELRRAIELDNDGLSEVAEDDICDAAIGGALIQAVNQVNAVYRFRNAVKIKQENRLLAYDGTSGGLFLFARALLVLSAVMAGSLFFKETRERCIVLAAGAAVILACKMQKLGQGLERKRGRHGTHNMERGHALG